MIYADLYKRIGDFVLEFSIEIKKGGFTALFGRSGAGKSTVLRLIAGLEKPDRGYISVDGEVWFDSEKGIDLPVRKRDIGFLFQDYALFPNMTVRENLLYAKNDPQRADFLLKISQMEGYGDRLPCELSGGQKQRAALARALMRSPKILLLDEPMSALDPVTRTLLQNELLNIKTLLGVTVLMVTHEFSDIYALCDEVAIIKEGRSVIRGTPDKVFGMGRTLSSFKIEATVLKIEKEGFLAVVTMRVFDQIVKSTVTAKEADELNAGDRVFIISKAFNPIIKKVDFRAV